MLNFGRSNVEKLKAKGDTQGLINLLGNKDSNVRSDAAKALASFGTRAVEPLDTALKNENVDVRVGALQALSSIRNANAARSLVTGLKDADAKVRRYALAMLLLTDAPVVEPLIIAMKELDKDMRETAEGAFVAMGAKVLEPLIALLKHDDGDVRSEAAWVLGTITTASSSQIFGDIRVIEPLIAALEDKYEGVRQNAAASLAKIGAAGILAKIDDSRVVEALITGLRDSSELVRRQCALSLGGIGNARAVEPLRLALQDESGSVRDMAAKALSWIGGEHSIESPGCEGTISLESLKNFVFQWSGTGFVGSNQAWVDKLRQENDSAIAWFNAQNFVAIPTFAGERGAAEYCFDMASQAQASGNIQEAWAGYHQALRRFCSLNDEKMIGLTSFNLGKAYGVRKNWEIAQLMFLQSAYFTDKIGDKKGYAWSVFYLSDTCAQLGNKSLARQFILQALPVFRQVSPENVPGIETALRRLSQD